MGKILRLQISRLDKIDMQKLRDDLANIYKALSLTLCSSLYTTLLWVRLFEGIPISISIFMPLTLSCPTKMPPQPLVN